MLTVALFGIPGMTRDCKMESLNEQLLTSGWIVILNTAIDCYAICLARYCRRHGELVAALSTCPCFPLAVHDKKQLDL